MIDITQKELLDKYGISLDKGTYTVEYLKDTYKINTLRDDTSGCVLVGLSLKDDTLLQSNMALSKVIKLIDKNSTISIIDIEKEEVEIKEKEKIKEEIITEPVITIQTETKINSSLKKTTWISYFLNWLTQIWNLLKTKS